MECLYGDQWTQQVEDDDKMLKITQKVVKNYPGKDAGSYKTAPAKPKGGYL